MHIPEPLDAQQLTALQGQRLGPYLSFHPVNATQIWQWCSVMGDLNPIYAPGAGQLAPPAMMQMWTMRDVNDRYAPGSTEAPPYRVFDDLRVLGYPANVAVSYDIRFHRYLRVGERVRHYTSIVRISERKATALGTGYFVTEQVQYQVQDDEIFAEALITYFQYAPAIGGDTAKARGETVDGDVPCPGDAPKPCCQPGERDFRDIVVSSLRAGDRLPELAIPITHRLIVAGAIATQDFTPVHHDLPAARAAGMPDIFMNILTTCGLSVRYLTDWAGSGSRLQRLEFKLMAPNLPGDVMHLSAEVTDVRVAAPTGAHVDVAFRGRNRRGSHISGNATMSLP